MPKSFNSQAKNTIRTKWATPLISFIRQKLNKKLFYLGLPSEEALDIQEWLDHLDVVYAFICRDYPNPSNPSQKRDKVLNLEALLREFERKRKLKTFEVFDGYLEEVVLKGRDNSPNPKPFFHDDLVTVYNLDYCNSVTSPIEFIDEEGNVKQAYKFQSIKKLMDMQSNLNLPTKKFLLFLTIGCSYDDGQTQNFLSNPPNSDIKTYLNKINRLSKGNKAPFILKAFVFYNLSHYFSSNNFAAEFLPVIHYQGNGNKPLLFFTIVGTQMPDLAGVPQSSPSIPQFLNYKFFSVSNDESFSNNQILLANGEIDWQNTDSIVLFKNSRIIQRYWGA